MATVLSLSGSPSAPSRTARLLRHLDARLAGHGHTVVTLDVRDLPAEVLLRGLHAHPDLAAATELVRAADGVLVGTPVYKAAYSGVLKSLLDLLPPDVLAGKAVLPLATGGSAAHSLAVDYALRPVLSAMGAALILPGRFVLDRHITTDADGATVVEPETAADLGALVDRFSALLAADRPLTPAP